MCVAFRSAKLRTFAERMATHKHGDTQAMTKATKKSCH